MEKFMKPLLVAALTTDAIAEFMSRDGFDRFWDQLPSEIQDEIEQAINERMAQTLGIFNVE